MAPILKKTDERLKKAGRKVEDVSKEIAHDTADAGKRIGKRIKDL